MIIANAFGVTMIDRATLTGYQRWATPVVTLMQRSQLASALVKPLALAWAQHMAYVMGATDQDTLLGRLLNTVGVPLNRGLGQ